MITRDQFEAHVRAEAKEKYPYDDGCPTGPYTAPSKRTIWEREAYIAARMEHEWPLVEALAAIAQVKVDSPSERFGDGGVLFRARKTAQRTLSSYTTKPIEP